MYFLDGIQLVKKDLNVLPNLITGPLTVCNHFSNNNIHNSNFVAIIVVFDFTNISTLSHCKQWLKEALNASGNEDPFIFLVGTKKDLVVGIKSVVLIIIHRNVILLNINR